MEQRESLEDVPTDLLQSLSVTERLPSEEPEEAEEKDETPNSIEQD